MLETSRIWDCAPTVPRLAPVSLAWLLAACATAEPPATPATVEPPAVSRGTSAPVPRPDPKASAEEARALLAQAETDIQRARARRALWARAWESLLAARAAQAAGDTAATAGHARRASDFAQLGLEQLAYPPVLYGPRQP